MGGSERSPKTERIYRGLSDLIASGMRSSSRRARSAAMPPRYVGTGVAVSTSTNAMAEKQTPAVAADMKHVVHVGDVESEDVKGNVLQRLDVVKNGQREEEEEDGQRSEHGQRYVQAAVELLPGAAVGALGEVMLIVLAHLRRDAGNVISPACQDGACDSVCASGNCHKVKDSLCKGCVRPLWSCAAHVARSGR